jgi:hypothetical protein
VRTRDAYLVHELQHLFCYIVGGVLAQPLGSRRQFRSATGPPRFAGAQPAPRERGRSPNPQLQSLLNRYVTCWEQADIPGLVGLLREDAWFTMLPLPVWVQGRAAITTWLATTLLVPNRSFRLLPTRANGSPAFGLYRRQNAEEVYQLFGLMVLGVEGERIISVVGFLEVSSLSCFALPPTLLQVL